MSRVAALTPEQLEEVVALKNDGLSVADIAEEYGVSDTTIYRALKQLNISPKRQHSLFDAIDAEKVVQQYLDWYPLKDIASEHGITLSQVYYILRTANVPARSKEPDAIEGREARMDTAVRMYEDGFMLHEIKEETGIPQPTLHEELRRRGIQFRRPRSTMTHEEMVNKVRKDMGNK